MIVAVQVLNADLTQVKRGQLGRIAIKLPLPPGAMATLFRADDRFKSVYFGEYPVSDSGEKMLGIFYMS